MRALFDWYDNLPAKGYTNLHLLIRVTILAALAILYYQTEPHGWYAVGGAGFMVLLLRCLYPKQIDEAEEKEQQYVCCLPVVWEEAGGHVYECWFHLYDGEDGREAIYVPAVRQSIMGDPQSIGEKHITYNKLVLPWINGVYTNDEMVEYCAKHNDHPLPPRPPAPKKVATGQKLLTLDEFRKK